MRRAISFKAGRKGAGVLLLGACIGAAALAGCEPRAPLVTPRVALVCADFSFPIYFEKGSDALTQPARQTIALSANRVKGCRIVAVEVLGLADADGPTHRNLVLSRRRADVVAQALAGQGLPVPKFDIDAIGETGATAPDGQALALRRKTEVVIHAAPPPPPPA